MSRKKLRPGRSIDVSGDPAHRNFASPNEIHLMVTDLGRGFEVEAALQGQGLGLMSMQERVRLLNGSIEIQSKPMGGTTIHIKVPFGSEHATRQAAG